MNADKIIEIARRYDPHEPDFVMATATLVAFAKAVIEADRESSDEPVAWMYPSTIERFKFNETFEQAYSIKVSRPGETTIPLYTRPAPARKPLSDEEIEDLFYTELDRRSLSFARAIKKAHGIGGAE